MRRNGGKSLSWRIREHWALIPVLIFCFGVAGVYALAGEHAQIAVSDNLDLFQAQYKMLKDSGTFWSKEASSIFLGGISRDVLPGELSLTSFLYQIFPPLVAYEGIYFVKIVISCISFVLLADELGKRGWLLPRKGKEKQGRETYSVLSWNLSLLCGLAYGMLNLFPSFGICFASIPLLVWLVLRLEREEKKSCCAGWLLALFCYPLLSYFSYFGFFILVYLCAAFLIKSIMDSVLGKKDGKTGVRGKKGFHPDGTLFLAIVFMAAGTVVCEYRLFGIMLFGDEETIRETMVQTSLSVQGILQQIGDVLVNGVSLHAQSVHKFIVLPICLLYLVLLNIGYIRRREWKNMAKDLFNISFLLVLVNAIVYGLYYSKIVRSFVETLLPMLTGFQFNRTAYFNPFLWYGMLFLCLFRLSVWMKVQFRSKEFHQVVKKISSFVPYAIVFAAMAVIFFSDTDYNDLLHTAKADAREVLGLQKSDALDYAEFYSEDLFDEILEDLSYNGEWAVAYGLHPAVLNYNGISTLDGYLGFYSQKYKEAFREVIAPALEENEATQQYYDTWGARCYIYSGHNTTVVEAVRNYPHAEDTIDIDSTALKNLGCRYIFSRIRITNAENKDLTRVGTYSSESSPYLIYVYEF